MKIAYISNGLDPLIQEFNKTNEKIVYFKNKTLNIVLKETGDELIFLINSIHIDSRNTRDTSYYFLQGSIGKDDHVVGITKITNKVKLTIGSRGNYTELYY